MGKASTNKKVARAAGTGGGRTARGQRPWGFYSILIVIGLLGLSILTFSRQERIDKVNSEPGRKERPFLAGKKAGEEADHWHMAFGFYLCDAYRSFIPDNVQATRAGIHTHGDGVIHVEPFTIADAGKNATIGRFLMLAGITVTEKEIKLPAWGTDPADPEVTKTNGDKCGDKAGRVRIQLDDNKDHVGDPNKIPLRDQTKIIFAFVPDGVDLPPLPSLDNLKKLKVDPNATEPTTTIPGDTVPGQTTVPGETTVPGQSTIPGESTIPGATIPGATTLPGATVNTSAAPGTTVKP